MNRKHLRSLAAVQRGKKNARSLEQDLVHFGVIPPGTLPPSGRLAEVRRNPQRLFGEAEYADRDGDSLERMMALRSSSGMESFHKYVNGMVSDYHKERVSGMMDGTPEKFFEILHAEAGLMTNLWRRLGTTLHISAGGVDVEKLQVERQSLVNRITDIALFVIRSKGSYKPGMPRSNHSRITIGGKDYAVTPELALLGGVLKPLKKRAGEEDGE